MKNNVKAMVWGIMNQSDRPITVTEIIEWLGDVPSHSVYGALESLIPYVRPVKGNVKRYIVSEKADFVWRIQKMTSNTPMTTREIANNLHITKQATQWHLNKMTESGLILRKYVNRCDHYCVQEAFDNLLRPCNHCQQVVEWSKRGNRWQCLNCGRWHR